MKVILLKNVNKLGKAGEIKEVNDGYARNFLIPNKLADIATAANVNSFKAPKKDKKQVKNRKRK